MTLDEIFAKMPGAVDAGGAAGVNAVVQFNCSTPRYVTIADGAATVAEGQADNATVSITMEDDDLRDLLTGQLDGMTAFMTGKVQLEGDMMFAQRLGSIFKL
ncbi:MAG: SCP2 sterol-binding domain-containing protein [Oceanococcaceae bacterium]